MSKRGRGRRTPEQRLMARAMRKVMADANRDLQPKGEKPKPRRRRTLDQIAADLNAALKRG